MQVTETGVPVDDLVDAVKAAVRAARISTVDTDRRMRVAELRLTLNVVATTSGGAKLEFRIPFVGMRFGFGGSVTSTDTHTVDITLVPPEATEPAYEVRGAEVDEVLVDAIETIGTVSAHAAGGPDSFLLKESTVELTFVVTAGGSISLGVSAETRDEVTHTLKLTIVPTR